MNYITVLLQMIIFIIFMFLFLYMVFNKRSKKKQLNTKAMEHKLDRIIELLEKDKNV